MFLGEINRDNIPARIKVMLINDTFNNISVISWRSFLLVGGNRVPGENHRPVANHWQTIT